MRKLLQSLAIVAALVVAPLRCVSSFAAVTDADIWWHLRVGQWIASGGGFPHSGLFTQHAERAWIAYSWGFELMVAAAFRVGQALIGNGLAGLTLFLVAAQCLLAAVIFRCVERTSRRIVCSAGLTAAVMFAYNAYAIRPMLFTILLYTITLYLLLSATREAEERKLWWLPPVFLLWANLHIQFVYGLFVVGVFAVAMTLVAIGAERGWLDAPAIAARTAWRVLGTCLLATWVGPYGWGVYRTIFGYAGNTSQYEQVQEFAAMSFRQAPHFVTLALVLFAFFALGWRRPKEPFRLLLLISTTLVAFRSQRDAWFVCIAAVLLLAEAIRSNHDVEFAPLPRRIVAACFGAALVIGVAAGAWRGLDAQRLIVQVDRHYPVRAASYILENRPPGPIYNTFNWGGYLEFNLREYPVSIDGRTDLFGPELDTRSMATANAYDLEHDPDFQKANVILIERFLPLASYLNADPRYKLAYADEMAVVFVRK